MAVVGVRTLPGAPLSLPAVTSGTTVPAAVQSLQQAARDAVADITTDVVVVVDGDERAGWVTGDLTMAGFGLPEDAAIWRGRGWDGVDAELGPLPVDARVLLRHVGPDRVRLVQAVTVNDATDVVVRLDGPDEVTLVACGDVSAGVGAKPPRPGDPMTQEQLAVVASAITGGNLGDLTGLDVPVLARPSLVTAMAAAARLGSRLAGSMHLARGVATFVSSTEIRGSG